MARSGASLGEPLAERGVRRLSVSPLTTPSLRPQVHGAGVFIFVLSIALIWTLILVSLAFSVAYRFSVNAGQNPIVLRVLRSTAWASTTILFLPFSSVLFRALACPAGPSWMGTSLQCYGGGHIAVCAVAIIGLACFLALTAFASASFVNRSMVSEW